jgi:hypothetical protein
MTSTVLGIDAGQQDRSELEHLLARATTACGGELGGVGRVMFACTHLVDGSGNGEEPGRHWAGSLEIADLALDLQVFAAALGGQVSVADTDGRRGGPEQWHRGALAAAGQLRDRRGGRVVLFPGKERLVGVLAAEQVAVLSAVTRLVGIADTPTSDVALDTRDFVRPEFLDGDLVLRVRPFGPDGNVAPFEVRDPTPCCPSHR